YTVPLVIPSKELELIMEKSMRELFEIPDDVFVQTYGVSITYEEINDGKSMLAFTLMFVAIPYCISYTIIVVAMLMSVLPLVILSIPVGIVTYGTIANGDLGLATLPLTAFVWLCPVAQVRDI
ncbi:hypothetical protein PMAYCL1PPCAC_17312, partial [Pristionchus mayeri]